ncbi:MAG: hypothetical protein HYV60_12300 [Planctomycetia bacterium]|nr:hypothetical protein [Planctomycetia bacterium]
MEQYEQLLKRSANAPVVFYFAGYGSLDTDWSPTILSYDARSRDPQGEIADISLLALAQLAAAAKRNVVPIVDAGSELGSSRFVVPEVKLADEPNAQKKSELAVTNFAGSLAAGTGEGPRPSMLEEGVEQVQGMLTHELLTEIRAVLDKGVHPASWDRQDVGPFLQDQEFFEPFWKPLFDTRTRSLAVDESLKKIWYIEIGALVEELDDIAARWPAEAAATLLDKCIVAAATGDYPTSLHAARQVMLQMNDSESFESEAKYHYGRVLYESRDNLLLAVDQLQAAVAADEVDLRARYYAGQAILALVQADYGPKASEHLGKYLAQGAPLGHYGAVLTTMARLHDSNRGELDEYGSKGADGAVPFERVLPRTHQQSAPSNQFAMGASAQGYLDDPGQPALKKWEVGAVIKVAFVNGDDQQKDRVKQAATEWTKYCNVSFEFIGDPNRAAVRTEFGNSGSWSYVGTDCLRLPATQATMALPDNDGLFGFDFKVHAWRSFGHVLGLGNEQSQPNANLPWNKQAVYVYYQRKWGWTRAMVDQNVLQVERDNALGIDKPFDRDSIMMYPIPAELLLDGREVTPRTELSLGDKRFVEELYPLLKPTGEFLRSALTERIDTHIHKLTITRPSNYVIETAGNTRVKLQLERASERGSSIGGHDSVDGVNDRIKARLTADNYTITVKHAQAGGLGEYRIRVTESD